MPNLSSPLYGLRAEPQWRRRERCELTLQTYEMINDLLMELPGPHQWKKQVLDNAASLFARGASGSGEGEEERERETAKLYAKIGQLTVERDFLARRPGR